MELRESLSQNIAYMLCSAHVTLVCDEFKRVILLSGKVNSLARSVQLLWLWVVGTDCGKVRGYGAERLRVYFRFALMNFELCTNTDANLNIHVVSNSSIRQC